MGHLYSQLQLRFCVDKTYYALRCIHLKEVKLKSTYVANDGTVTATVSLRDGKGLTGQVAFSDPAATTPTTPEEMSLPIGGNEELKVEPEANAANPEYTVLPKTVNCAPCLFTANGAYLSVETTYDVYDRDKTQVHGNLIRANCKATNKIQVSGMAPGVRKMLTLTVAFAFTCPVDLGRRSFRALGLMSVEVTRKKIRSRNTISVILDTENCASTFVFLFSAITSQMLRVR